MIILFILNLAFATETTTHQLVSLEELADRREKEEQEEKRGLFENKTLEKVVNNPGNEEAKEKNKNTEAEKKSCEVVHFTGRKGTAFIKRYLSEPECLTLCQEKAHPEKITHCFFDKKVIWRNK